VGFGYTSGIGVLSFAFSLPFFFFFFSFARVLEDSAAIVHALFMNNSRTI